VLGGELSVDSQATYLTRYDVDEKGDGTVFNGVENRNNFVDLLGSVPDLRAIVGFT
jgi:hypothetical protein